MQHHPECIAISVSLLQLTTQQRLRSVLVNIFMLLVFGTCCIGLAGQEVSVTSTPHSLWVSKDLQPSLRAAGILPLRVTVDLVLVPVTVTDVNGLAVTGVDRDDFQIIEDGQRQTIQHVSYEDAPISVGIIFDTSGSSGRIKGTSL
jgi:hypothetical protein